MNLDDALDELYSAPIEEFTAKRNALAKQLTGEAARIVKSLKKPNLAAWAVNQVARNHTGDVDVLFEVTDNVRRAQRRVLSGGKASDLRAATDARNKAVARLQKLAEKILTSAGHGASASTLQAVGDSFMAVAGDDAGAELVRKGRLTRELEPSPFLDVSGLTLVESPESTERRKEQRSSNQEIVVEARRVVSTLRGSVKDARAAFKEADRHAEKLARAAEEVERRAKAAREEAEFARRAAEARRSELDEVEQRLEASQAALKDLESR